MLDRDPRIIVSTFETYEQLGRSYWAATEHKAKPTPEIVKLAAAAGMPIVPRGAGTGLAGGSTPIRGGVRLRTKGRARRPQREGRAPGSNGISSRACGR